MYNDDEEQEEGPKSSFTTYLAEGDVLFKQAEYKKALDSYNLVSFRGLYISRQQLQEYYFGLLFER